MNFEAKYQSKIDAIDNYIDNYLSSYKNASPELIDAMKYSVLNGGKRLRSILCTEICTMLGGEYTKAIPFACSIELIHAYSLVHDDLPAMDNADLRRGIPSCHKKYGETMGILCGDALLNSAYELMADNCTDAHTIKAMQTLAISAGAEGMISGQVKDMKLGSCSSVSEKTLIDMIEQKTMAIIKSSIIAGTYLAKYDDEILDDMNNFAYSLGVAFQIRDDFEDIEEDIETQNDSPNFINSMGRENAAKLLKQHADNCKNIISKYSNNEFMSDFLNFLFI